MNKFLYLCTSQSCSKFRVTKLTCKILTDSLLLKQRMRLKACMCARRVDYTAKNSISVICQQRSSSSSSALEWSVGSDGLLVGHSER